MKEGLRVVPPRLSPYALLELPASILQLTAEVLRNLGSTGENDNQSILFNLALTEISHYPIYSQSPGSLESGEARHIESGAILTTAPFEFERDRLVNNTGECIHRVALWIYHQFGFPDDDLPREFDRKSGKLSL